MPLVSISQPPNRMPLLQDTDLNAVSTALATHMAEACSSPEHLETVAAALAQHLLKQEATWHICIGVRVSVCSRCEAARLCGQQLLQAVQVEVPVEGLADVVAKA